MDHLALAGVVVWLGVLAGLMWLSGECNRQSVADQRSRAKHAAQATAEFAGVLWFFTSLLTAGTYIHWWLDGDMYEPLLKATVVSLLGMYILTVNSCVVLCMKDKARRHV